MILSEAIKIEKGTTDVVAVYRGSTLVWPLTQALWTFASGLTGAITGFRAVFTGTAKALFDSVATTLTSNVSANLNATSAALDLSPPASITRITCGTSSPKLGGTIDVSAFLNLTSIVCQNNGITGFQGYGALTNLIEIDLRDNNLVQSSFETLSNKPNLQIVNFGTSTTNGLPGMTGAFPTFLQNLNLTTLAINNTNLTGSNLNLSHLTNLTTASIQSNSLSGSFPVFPTGANSKLTVIHVGQTSAKSFRFTGTPPQFSDHPNLNTLLYPNNSATGSIQSIPSRATNFQCFSNQHTGNIPSLAGTNLGTFLCQANQLTGFAGGAVPASLGNFQAQNNQLSASAVNALLAAFVAAGRTTGTRILNLGGTGNAAPTGQGVIDKATLESRGWTVTTN